MFINTLLKNTLLKFLITTITVVSINIIPINIVNADDDVDVDEARVVKIGYATNQGVLKSNPTVAGSEGYGYELLNKIIEYTDGDYALEFVEVEWSNGLELLSNGEVDILAPANYSVQREKEYIFSENIFAVDTALITSVEDFNLIGYDGLNGSTIAVQKDYIMIDSLNDFLDKHNISADIIEVEVTSYVNRMENIEYDCLLASSLLLEGTLNVVSKLSSEPTYLMANKNNAELIKDFDRAIDRIEIDEYLFKERLYLEYYEHTIDDDVYISQAEYELIHETPIYQVGYSPDNAPLTYLNEAGELVGVAIEVMDMIAEDSGIEFNFIDITQNNINLDVTDISLLPPNFENSYFKSKQSVPFTYFNYFLIENQGYDDNIGILSLYDMLPSTLDNVIKDGKIFEFSDNDALMRAFDYGDISRIVLTSIVYNQSHTSLNNGDYTISPLSDKLPIVMGFNSKFEQEKIDIFNKFINRLDTTIVDYSMNEHTALMRVTSITDVIKDNPIIVNTFLFLVGFIFFIIIMFMLKQKRDLSYMLNYDRVTNLYSQHKFINLTKKLIKGDKDYTILSLDIDNFKYINEIYGYEVGSKVLKKLGYYIKYMMKSNNPVSRGMADGFLVLLETEDAVKNIREGLLRDTDVMLKGLNEVLGDDYNFSFSLGYYNIKDTSLDLSFMIDCANIAKNEGKKIVGTTINEYTEEMNNKRITINEVIATMNKGIENREFIVHYQPKFDLTTMELVGAEALVRWNKNIKVISPDQFIPIFEKNGFIEKLDYYIVESVCDFIRKNNDVDLPLISLNLSGITIMRENLVDRIVNIIDRYGISSSQLELEITESAFIDNFELGVDKLVKLSELGFQISMDDFGAGISSLNRLKEMPIDVLKIDREFIVDSLVNEKGNKIIKNIINMAKDLELETIAEGIETTEQLEFLKDLGCNLGQGYFYSKPLPPYDFVKKVKLENKQK